MKELQALAAQAARHRIRGRSYKRNSLLKPLDFILAELERCPDQRDENELAFARTSSKGLIYDHVKRVAKGVHEEEIYRYVDLFFDGVLRQAHHNNINRLLQRERSLRSAYLVYMREELANLFVARGKAKSADEAFQEINQAEAEDSEEEENE
ncbi:MAG: hypothetical protein IMW89_17405 [Ktedonobacteraceae bacterium]|nr:hypothetical protein [Ktedonobacteraceae bacterium]